MSFRSKKLFSKHRDTHTRLTALPGPLKWVCNKKNYSMIADEHGR